MTLPAPVRSTARPGTGSRLGALAALVVAAGHLPGVPGHLRTAPALAALLLALTAVCGHCAWGLWRAPSTRTWCAAAGMAVGMAVLHLLLPAGHAHLPGGGAVAGTAAETVPAVAGTTGTGHATMQAMAGMPGMAGPGLAGATGAGSSGPPALDELAWGAQALLVMLAAAALLRPHLASRLRAGPAAHPVQLSGPSGPSGLRAGPAAHPVS